MAEGGFLARWSRRKAGDRSDAVAVAAERDEAPANGAPGSAGAGEPALPVTPALPVVPVDPGCTPAAPAPQPLPTLADVALLTPASDFSRFVASGVPRDVSNAAMKKLFSDPHFNIMDGLDTYIGDYGKPDPIPLSMLRLLNQAESLGLFRADDEPGAGAEEPAEGAGAAAMPHPDGDGAADAASAQSIAPEPLAGPATAPRRPLA